MKAMQSRSSRAALFRLRDRMFFCRMQTIEQIDAGVLRLVFPDAFAVYADAADT